MTTTLHVTMRSRAERVRESKHAVYAGRYPDTPVSCMLGMSENRQLSSYIFTWVLDETRVINFAQQTPLPTESHHQLKTSLYFTQMTNVHTYYSFLKDFLFFFFS